MPIPRFGRLRFAGSHATLPHMFPPIRQRILFAIAVLIAGYLAAGLADSVGLGNGVGSSLLYSGSPGGALAACAAWSAVALVLALLCSSAGNPLSGYAVISGALLVYAWKGGSSEAWLSAIESPAAYHRLTIEALVWAAPYVVLTLALRYLRGPVRSRLPGLMRHAFCNEIHDDDPTLDNGAMINAAVTVVIALGIVFFQRREAFASMVAVTAIALGLMVVLWGLSMLIETAIQHAEHEQHREHLRAPMAPAFLSGAMTIVLASALIALLQQTAVSGQVIGATLLGFLVAGSFAHQAFPTPSRLPILLSPLVIAVAGYLYVAFAFDSAEDMLKLFNQRYGEPLTPHALAMPAFYASAGVLGAALGVGWSQTAHENRKKHVALVN